MFINPRAVAANYPPPPALVAGTFVAAPAGLLVQTAWAAVLAGVMIVFSHNTPSEGLLYAGVAVAALLVAIVGSIAAYPPPAGWGSAQWEKPTKRRLG